MKRVLAVLLAIMLLVSFAACTKTGTDVPKTEDPTTAPVTEGEATSSPEQVIDEIEYVDTYKTYFSRSYASFNYYSTAYTTVREIVTNTIDGLVEPDIYGVYIPSLAESWTSNEDQTVWTFKIREGLYWVDHNGDKTEYAITAQDFVDGIRYIGDPLNGAYSMRVIRNLITGLYDYYWDLDDFDDPDVESSHATREEIIATFDESVGVKALDDCTVEYTLDNSAPYFLSLIESSMLLLPVEYDYAMAMGEDFGVDNEHLLYCGAYYISHFEHDKAITLSANPYYWDTDNVTLKTIEYQIIPDGTTSIEMYKRGEIDYTSVAAEEYLSLQGTEWEDNLIPNSYSFSTNYFWLNFIGENSEFRTFVQNENFRKALQYSIDRLSLASLRDPVNPSRVLRNTVNAEGAIYDRNGVDYTDYEPLKSIKEIDYYQPELARQYFEAAIAELCDADGNIIGVDAATVDYLPMLQFDIDGKLPVTMVYVGTDDEDEIIMAQLLEAMIEESLGADYIDVVLAFDTSGSFYSTVTDPYKFDIFFDSLSTGYADPSGILTRTTSDGAENMGAYEIPEYDELIEKALAAATFEERLQYFAEAEAYLCNGAYFIPYVSGLRGYHMTNEVPYTGPRTLYGNVKYKGQLVSVEPLTVDQYNTLTASYEIARAEALKNAGN